MKSIVSLLMAMFLFWFSSCQKNGLETEPPITPPVVTPVDSTSHDSITVLSKVIFFDLFSSANDTAFVSYFVFDSLRRVTAINEFDYTGGMPEPSEEVKYFYTGNDSMAFKSTNEETGNPNLSTEYYFYDNAGRLIRDSFISRQQETVVATYQYFSDKITVAYLQNAYDTGFLDASGNVIRTEAYQNLINYHFTTTFTYDTHPNPLSLINISSTFDHVPEESADFGEIISVNNPLSFAVQNHQQPDLNFSYKYTYEYNTDGFPVSVTTIKDGTTEEAEEKIVFVYKKLKQ